MSLKETKKPIISSIQQEKKHKFLENLTKMKESIVESSMQSATLGDETTKRIIPIDSSDDEKKQKTQSLYLMEIMTSLKQ